MGQRTRARVRWSLALAAGTIAALAVGTTPASAGGGCHSSASAARTTRVEIRDLCFGPTVAYVEPGATVRWTNQDSFEHTVTGLGWQWGSEANLTESAVLSQRFTKPGVYPYSCILHPGMVGAIVVGDAGSPTAVQGLVLPAPVLQASSQPANGGQPAAGSDTAVAKPLDSWPLVPALVLAVLLAAATGAVLWRRRLIRRDSGVPA
jgi:plastocyanin